jgi:hypothetical protein
VGSWENGGVVCAPRIEREAHIHVRAPVWPGSQRSPAHEPPGAQMGVQPGTEPAHSRLLIPACMLISARVCRHPTAACVLTAPDLSTYCCLGNRRVRAGADRAATPWTWAKTTKCAAGHAGTAFCTRPVSRGPCSTRHDDEC